MFLTSDGDSQAKVTLFREIWRITLSNWYQAWQGGVRRQVELRGLVSYNLIDKSNFL